MEIDKKQFDYAQCDICKHRVSILSCKAFKRGIPSMILSGEFDHKNPFPDNKNRKDNNITFEEK